MRPALCLDRLRRGAVNAGMNNSALITGLQGTALTVQERHFLEQTRPIGVILFARNIGAPAEVAALCGQVRAALRDEQALIFIDQEGGRVQRLRPPSWGQFAPARYFGRLYESDRAAGLEAAWVQARLIGDDLLRLGINGVCSPCLDISIPGAHDVIGDRSFSSDPQAVAALGAASHEGTLAAGVLPVIKHIPGHGRSLADSHLELPRVNTEGALLSASDFVPFAALRHSPFAMTAHIVYEAFDSVYPATLSKLVIDEVIRGEIGFSGALMSDDLGMKALKGSFEDLARGCREVGIDVVLHCSGNFEEMEQVARGCGMLTGKAAERVGYALSHRKAPAPFDRAGAEARLTQLLALVGAQDAFKPADARGAGAGHV